MTRKSLRLDFLGPRGDKGQGKRLFVLAVLFVAMTGNALDAPFAGTNDKTTRIAATTPDPRRFVVRGTSLVDRRTG